jgi:hypothetical protein
VLDVAGNYFNQCCALQAGGMLDKNSAPTGNVKVTMCYYGTSVNLESDRIDRRDDVVVEQQHCGGNTLTVFRGKILPGGTWQSNIASLSY